MRRQTSRQSALGEMAKRLKGELAGKDVGTYSHTACMAVAARILGERNMMSALSHERRGEGPAAPSLQDLVTELEMAQSRIDMLQGIVDSALDLHREKYENDEEVEGSDLIGAFGNWRLDVARQLAESNPDRQAKTCGERLRIALTALSGAERFIAGFEDDKAQDGVADLLQTIRSALEGSQAPATAPRSAAKVGRQDMAAERHAAGDAAQRTAMLQGLVDQALAFYDEEFEGDLSMDGADLVETMGIWREEARRRIAAFDQTPVTREQAEASQMGIIASGRGTILLRRLASAVAEGREPREEMEEATAFLDQVNLPIGSDAKRAFAGIPA